MAALIVFVLAVATVALMLVKTRRVLETIYRQIGRRREELGLPPLSGEFSIWKEPGRLWVEIAELQVAEKQSELRAKNTQFVLSALLQGMFEGVAVVDAQGKIRAANEALKRIFGATSDVVGLSLSEAFRNKEIYDLFQRALQEGQVLHHTMEIGTPAQRLLEVNASAVLGSDGKANGTVLVLHDQTRLKHLENTRKQFVANVSHEIRTPLSIVKGYLEALNDNPGLDAPQRKQFIQIMHRNTERISSLVRDLLLLSKLESKEAQDSFESVDIHALLKQASEDFKPVCAEQKIVLNVTPTLESLRARGDPSRLRQVMDNLLDNAVRYSPAHSKITLSAQSEKSLIKVSVVDQGCGISETDIPHLFERFYRAEKSRGRAPGSKDSHGGTGLGLSIVQQIVQQHGGQVWVESEIGRGSTFFFTIPRLDGSG